MRRFTVPIATKTGGNTATASGITLPCFKIENFVLKMSEGSERTIKQWSKRPFEVAAAEFGDFL